jgi:hypothetical protein
MCNQTCQSLGSLGTGEINGSLIDVLLITINSRADCHFARIPTCVINVVNHFAL